MGSKQKMIDEFSTKIAGAICSSEQLDEIFAKALIDVLYEELFIKER